MNMANTCIIGCGFKVLTMVSRTHCICMTNQQIYTPLVNWLTGSYVCFVTGYDLLVSFTALIIYGCIYIHTLVVTS